MNCDTLSGELALLNRKLEPVINQCVAAVVPPKSMRACQGRAGGPHGRVSVFVSCVAAICVPSARQSPRQLEGVRACLASLPD